MPIYEYHCSNCGTDFEKLIRFSDPQLNSPECPGCQSKNTGKKLSVISAFSTAGSAASPTTGCRSSGPFR